MQLDGAIQSRSSIKKFKDKKPDWRDIIECIDSTRFAPMAGNNFTPKFILVSDSEKIQKIGEASQQPFVSKAHYIVVVCSNPKNTLNAYGKQGEIWVRQQAGAAIQNFLLKIVEKKLATTWVGYFVERTIKQILKIPDEIQVEAIFPIGYAYTKTKIKKQKIDLDEALYFEEYKNKKMKPIRKIE